MPTVSKVKDWKPRTVPVRVIVKLQPTGSSRKIRRKAHKKRWPAVLKRVVSGALILRLHEPPASAVGHPESMGAQHNSPPILFPRSVAAWQHRQTSIVATKLAAASTCSPPSDEVYTTEASRTPIEMQAAASFSPHKRARPRIVNITPALCEYVSPAAERVKNMGSTWRRSSRLEEISEVHNLSCGERYRRGFRDRITTEMWPMVPEASRRRCSYAEKI
ncbi:hypothetical protein MRX96_036089 [Rhipicephalus microplus]